MQHSNKPPGDNTHAKAAGAYGDHAQKHTPDQRELEARVLLKAARMLQDLRDDFENIDSEAIAETLKYNRQIWIMFYDTAIENKGEEHTSALRSNIINLANFIFKRETEILSNPSAEKLDVLININREISAGLMGSPDTSSDQP
jgi:flagellar protein FlaF